MRQALRLGTRGSPLALYQTELVKAKILEDFPLLEVEAVKIKTSGDMVRRGGMHPSETKRIFTREIEEALLGGQIDMAVHSAKDMAVPLPQGLSIGAVLEREDSRDCLIAKDGKKIAELPLGARVGTSSLRRKMQLLRLHPNLIVEEVHGNVETRIRKVEEGYYDAVVLAYAGIKRLGLINHVSEIFSEVSFYPAPGQGIVAIQARSGDTDIEEILTTVNHAPTHKRLDCERAFLEKLEGGCQLPCGVMTHLQGERIQARGAIFSLESRHWVEAELEGVNESPIAIGIQLAQSILEKGGQEILEGIRGK